jgi:hypothetical protein
METAMLNADDLTALADRLAAESEAYAALLAATGAHHAALLAGAPSGVEASLHTQLAALAVCRGASDARAACTQELAAALGLGLPCRTGRLLGVLPESPVLRTAYAELRQRCDELRQLNAANRRLDEHRLDLLQGDFAALQAMLTGAASGDPGNGPSASGSFLSLRA